MREKRCGVSQCHINNTRFSNKNFILYRYADVGQQLHTGKRESFFAV